MNTSDENLFDYISERYHRICLDYIIVKIDNSQINMGMVC
jgi:hypothetical protein